MKMKIKIFSNKGKESTCTKCRGVGVVPVKIPNADYTETCPACNVTGTKNRNPEYV